MKLLGLGLVISIAAWGEHSSSRLDSSKLPNFSALRTLAVTSDVSRAFRQDRPQNWKDWERSLGISLIPPGREASLPPFDAVQVEQALGEVSLNLRANPPQSWAELSRTLQPLTAVVPEDLVQSFIVQKVLAREEEGDPLSPVEPKTDASSSPPEADSEGAEPALGATGTNSLRGTNPLLSASPLPSPAFSQTPYNPPKPTPLARAKNRWLKQRLPAMIQLASLLPPTQTPDTSTNQKRNPRSTSPKGPVLDQPSEAVQSTPPVPKGEGIPSTVADSETKPSPQPLKRMPPLPQGSVAGTTSGNPPLPLSFWDQTPKAFSMQTYSPPKNLGNPRQRKNVSVRLGSSTPFNSSVTSVNANPSPENEGFQFPRANPRAVAKSLAQALRRLNSPNANGASNKGTKRKAGDHPKAWANYPRGSRQLASMTGIPVQGAHLLYQGAQAVAWGGTWIWLTYALGWFRRRKANS